MGPGRQKTNLSLICAAAAAGVGLEPQCAVRRAEWSWIIVTFRFFFLCLVRRPEICGWSRRTGDYMATPYHPKKSIHSGS